MMVEFVMLVMGVALFFYTVLGGADFGAGIIEMLTGERSIRTISKAIAPVWEANHVWLILVLVVIFNGFPKVFSTMSIMLHIPLLLVLVGMIFRGTAFTFRHYDVIEDSSHRYYHFCFRASSLLTPFFLGMTLGAVILGRISPDLNAGFYAVFIAPWLNAFCIGMGLFTTLLFSYVSAVFLIGEVETEEGRQIMITYSKRSLIALMLLGALIMALAEWSGLALFQQFLAQPISLATIILATLLIPLIFRTIEKRQINTMRVLVGGQVAVIFIGWAAVQFPDFIRFNDGTALTIYNTAAGAATFRQLVIALTVGVLIILPAFFYLFKVFKQKV
ncbi:MAG: cytochrome d ubiquinol oxidase subunit II [Bacteroidota bacterium]